MLPGKPASHKHAVPLYIALALFAIFMIYLFVTAKHRKDLPQKAAPLNHQPAIVWFGGLNRWLL